MLPAVLASLFMTVAQQLPTVNPPKNGECDRAPLKVKPRAERDVAFRAALSRAEDAVAGGSLAVGGEDADALGRNEVLDDRLLDGGGQLGDAVRGTDLALDEKAHILLLLLVAAGQLQR
jgi:hypothetical protein